MGRCGHLDSCSWCVSCNETQLQYIKRDLQTAKDNVTGLQVKHDALLARLVRLVEAEQEADAQEAAMNGGG